MNKETPKRTPLTSVYRNSAAVLPWMLCAATLMAAGAARAGGALPTNGQYVAGQGSIASAANNVTVNQSSSHGIINWQGFSISQGNSVLFNNGSGATLNRVTGGQLSEIEGSLKATGSVYLINPQGIVIGPSGQVITNGSFVASTRDVDNNAFMSGQAFSASGTSSGSIINQGVITSNTGDAILVGSAVTNTGSIFAPNGTIGLAAGNEITLQPAGTDSRISISGGTGSVTNSGNLKAAQAELNAAGGNVYALVENNGGAISATGTANVGGHIWLTAGSTGTVTVAGAVNAQNADGSGGSVTARGYDINLPGSINASAVTASGNGGNVSVVASNNTTVSGSIHAGGGASGQGGTIETSGHTLAFGGADINAGQGGNWLLDPYDLTVTSSAATTIDNSLDAGTSVMLQTTATGTSGPGTANSSGTGNININAPLSWNTSARLTLNAYANIVFGANVNVQNGGGLVMVTNSSGAGGDYYIDPGDSIQFPNGGSLNINSVTYTLLYSAQQMESAILNSNDPNSLYDDYALAMPSNAGGYVIPSPIGYYLGSSPYLFYGTFTGLGNTISNLVVNGSGCCGISQNNALFGYLASGAVVRNLGLINETVTNNNAAGLVSVNDGLVEYDFTTGSVSSSYAGGLVYNNNGTILDSYSAASVHGSSGAGGLVYNNNGTITSSYATGAVTGSAALGGLVAYNFGGINNSYATGSVNGGGYVGGLVGIQKGSISQSYATGDITYTGGGAAGGLVGFNNATITSSLWDSTATGQSSGIGTNYGTGGVTPLTTAQFQSGSLPSGFSSSTWATGTGLYPYLKGIYPTGISVISGTVENNTDTATLANVTVSTDVGGNFFASATTGPNGYFYEAGLPVTAGSNALAYIGGNAATLIPSVTAAGASNVVLIANTLSDTTSATSLSQVSHANLATLYDAAATNDSVALSTVANVPGEALFDSGASFTVDQPISGNLFVKMSAANAPITVSQPITLTGSNALTLDATGNIAIDGNVTASGGNAVSFTTGVGDSYSLGFGDSISFSGGSTAGASLTINGNPYTLIYSMGALQNIDNALGGDYALATSLNAATDPTTPATWTPIAGSQIFTGIFEGLGNTVSNLSASGVNGGLFAVSSGTIRDVGVIGGTFTGSAFAGALAGQNFGLIEDSYATASVSGAPDTGGLVGYNTGTLVNDYAQGSVNGTDAAGGLVGYNTSTGMIGQSFATSTVNGAAYAGGLVGENIGGAIGNSFAMGPVSGTTDTGGLIGNNTGTIGNAYATGYITGSGLGGLVGTGAGAVTDSFWDTSTTGQNGGDTTAQLQGALPGTFNSSVWSTGTGLYPYLTNLFGKGVAAVSGTAYSNAGTTALTGVTIGVDVGGNLFSSATTGANGYYYAFGQPLAAGANTLAYVNGGDAATLANNAATTGLTGVNIYGNTLSEATSATLLSQLSGGVQSLANAAATNDASGLAAIAAAPNVELLDTAASFTVDQPWTPSYSLIVQMTGANAPIIVADPITLTGTHALTLNATGNVAFDADVTVTGGGALSFSNGAGDGYSLTFGDNIAFTGGASSGASLTINGTPYTLIYSMGQLENINSKPGGDYALATSLDAATDPTTPASWTPIGNVTNGLFTGTFEGLDNTISNLTVNIGANNYAGLFGYVSGSTIRDVGLIAGSVTGGNYTGGLAGYNGGSITQSYATGNATGNNYVGGLVGSNPRNSAITLSYATGNVSGNDYVGGLGGYNDGTINETYATGAVTGYPYYRGGYTGGLIGLSSSGSTISNSFATGAVAGSYGGGLVGWARDASISNSYAIGPVTGTGGYYGPFAALGGQGTTISGIYYNTQTTGGHNYPQGGDIGATGLTTAQLQGTLPSGFSSSIWSTGAGLYPYLTALFPNGIAVVSGTAQANGTVSVDVNGSTFATAPIAANASYYAFGQPFAADSTALAYTSNNNGSSLTYTDNMPSTGSTEFNLRPNTLSATTGASSYSALNSDLIAAANGDVGAFTALANLTSLNITATGTSFALDRPITLAGTNTLTINAAGSLSFDDDVTVTGAGTVSFSTGAGSNYTIAPSDNISFTAPEGSGQTLTIDGTQYTLLYSMSDVQNITGGLSGDYALATSLNAATDPTTPASWIPIGTNGQGSIVGKGFAGIFAGLGKTISNLAVNIGTDRYAGLFGYSSGTIRDLGLIDVSVTGGYDVGALVGVNSSTGTITNSYAAGGAMNGLGDVGGLAGYNQGAVGNSYATDAATGSVNWIGGLVGYNAGGTIGSSYATGAVSGAGSVGGLVGYNNYAGTISNTYALGTVGALGMGATGGYAGGLVGYNAGAVRDSYATGAIVGSSGLGGLVGRNSGTVSSSFWDTQTAGQRNGIGSDSNNQSGNVTGLTTAQMMAAASFTGWTFGGLGSGATWVLVDNDGGALATVGGTINNLNGATGGTTPMLLSEYATNISNAHQLQLMALNPSANYALTNDIDLSATQLGGDVWGAAGFMPVLLIGTFNGGGYAISNLYENNTSNLKGSGLFGQIRGTGVVDDLIIEGADITGGNYAGALAGSNLGTVQNVLVESYGTTPTTISGANDVGGLIGWNGGTIGGAGTTVTDGNDQMSGLGGAVGVTAEVTGTQTRAGGLVGWNTDQISGSGSSPTYAEGAVTGGTQIGGLVGWNDGTISDAQVWTVNVSSTGYGVGGLVGYNTATGQIENSGVSGSDATGSITTQGSVDGPGGVGGFVGVNSGSLQSDDVTQTNIGSLATYGAGGFAGQNTATGAIDGSHVTDSDTIGTSYVGGFVANNFGSIDSSTATTTTAQASHSVSGTGYVGGFAGGNEVGASITNSSSSENNAGAASVDGTGSRVGGFVGWNAGTLGSDQSSDAVTGASQVGGFVGWNDGSVTDSQAWTVAATGTVYGAGGFVGYNAATGSIQDSSVSGSNKAGTVLTAGKVDDTAGGVGGFAGLNAGSLSSDSVAQTEIGDALAGVVGGFAGQNAASGVASGDTVTTTDVIGASYVGGFAGSNLGSIGGSTVTTTSTPGSAAISGVNEVGGFVGTNAIGGTIADSSSSDTNTGAISVAATGNRVGGFAGWNQAALNGNQSSDAVTGVDQVGGLVGWNDGTISVSTDEATFSTGAVSGVAQVGGFVGWNNGAVTDAQVWTVSVSATGYGAGGFVGYNTAAGNIQGSGASGSDEASTVLTTGKVDNTAGGVGGFVGLNAGSLSSDSVTQTTVGDALAGVAGGFAGQNTGTISYSSITTSDVVGTSYVGGFVGTNTGGISYSTVTTTTAPGFNSINGVNEVGGFAGTNAAGGMITYSSSSETNPGTVSVAGTGDRVGGFVGWNVGGLSNDQSSDAVSGVEMVGGLVGWNDGAILDTSADGTVTATNIAAGGLVGYNTALATIKSSYATSPSVTGTGYVGGLVGDNLGTITNAYATGSIGAASINYVGGLVGWNSGAISDVYAAATVIGKTGQIGALIGKNMATGVVSDGYYDAAISGTTPGYGVNLGTLSATAIGGAGEADPTLQATFIGFDFDNVWTTAPGEMPTLLHAP